MKVALYSFFEIEGLNDQAKLFYWFMSKIMSEGGIDQVYTISNYDLKVLLRGHSSGEFTKNSVPDHVNNHFRVGFVSGARQTIQLNKEILNDRRTVKGKILGKIIEIELTEPKVVAMYLYLLGVFAGAGNMFYEEKYFGLGDKDDSQYHTLSKVLTRQEISSLLNGAQVDTAQL